MSKPLTIEIDEAAAERLAQIANDMGETPEEYAARILKANLDSAESSVFFARRAKGFDRAQAAAWLKEMQARTCAPEPDPDDTLPDGYVRR
jgi:hypothetical protein